MCRIIEEADMEVRIEIAIKLLKNGQFDQNTIAEVTKLPIEKVQELAEQLKSASA